MLMACRFCGGDVKVEESWIRASPVHVICVGGFMARCEGCGRQSGFSTDKEMALRSMCLNLDGPAGQNLIADVLRAAKGASYFLPPFGRTRNLLKRLIVDLERLSIKPERST